MKNLIQYFKTLYLFNSTRVFVTQEHIDRGEPKKGMFCPIALALEDAFKEKYYVGTSSCINGKPSDKGAIFNKRVQQFIRDFDYGKKVTPFSFKIRMTIFP
jgi:hypothetical protein